MTLEGPWEGPWDHPGTPLDPDLKKVLKIIKTIAFLDLILETFFHHFFCIFHCSFKLRLGELSKPLFKGFKNHFEGGLPFTYDQKELAIFRPTLVFALARHIFFFFSPSSLCSPSPLCVSSGLRALRSTSRCWQSFAGFCRP